jgi:hypothetical protein
MVDTLFYHSLGGGTKTISQHLTDSQVDFEQHKTSTGSKLRETVLGI